MTDPHLFSVLDRATDGIETVDPSQAATAALTRARVIRTRRRGLVAGGVAAVAVVAVVVATGVTGSDRSTPPITPSSTVPEMPDSAVQPTWDPRGATGLPQRTTSLPQTIEPARDAGPLPLATAALLVMDDSAEGLYVLGQDGTWARTTAPSGSSYVTSISDDGTMLANVGPQGLWVTDVRDGDWRQLDLPEPTMVWEGLGTSLTWRGDSGLVLRSGGGDLGFVDVDGSRVTGDAYDGTLVSGFALAPDGTEVVFGDGRDGKVIREGRDGAQTRTFAADALERVSLPVASDRRVAGVVSGIPRADRPTDHAGVVVLERAGYATEAYLPIARTTYTAGVNGISLGVSGVRPLAWLDDRTLLLMHAPTFGRPWELVAWDVESGDLTLVSTGTSTAQPAGVARDLVHD